MKQLLILSGKGGTGKTTIAGAFIKLAQAQGYADCDVDAPNLHLITDSFSAPTVEPYYGMDKAVIDQELCIACGICAEHCRFNAIDSLQGFHVIPYACEGCSVCQLVCPVNAIRLERAIGGELRLYKKTNAVFSTAQLKMGSGNSGLLVTEVKKGLYQAAEKVPLAIVDGPPGLGCPVHASLSGVDLVLLIAEPSVAGLSDLERILDTVAKFSIKQVVCINKFDISPELTERIVLLCREKDVPLVGKIPFDPKVQQAVNEGLTIVDLPCQAGESVKEVFARTRTFLDK